MNFSDPFYLGVILMRRIGLQEEVGVIVPKLVARPGQFSIKLNSESLLCFPCACTVFYSGSQTKLNRFWSCTFSLLPESDYAASYSFRSNLLPKILSLSNRRGTVFVFRVLRILFVIRGLIGLGFETRPSCDTACCYYCPIFSYPSCLQIRSNQYSLGISGGKCGSSKCPTYLSKNSS